MILLLLLIVLFICGFADYILYREWYKLPRPVRYVFDFWERIDGGTRLRHIVFTDTGMVLKNEIVDAQPLPIITYTNPNRIDFGDYYIERKETP